MHLTTFVPSLSFGWIRDLPFGLGGMLSFILMMGLLPRDAQALAQDGSDLSATKSSQSVTDVKNRRLEAMQHILKAVPERSKLVCVGVFLYGVFSFGIFTMRWEGVPQEENGHYYLHNHGTRIRDITAEEYERLRRLDLRATSAHSLIFSFVPLLFFLHVAPLIDSGERDGTKTNKENSVRRN